MLRRIAQRPRVTGGACGFGFGSPTRRALADPHGDARVCLHCGTSLITEKKADDSEVSCPMGMALAQIADYAVPAVAKARFTLILSSMETL